MNKKTIALALLLLFTAVNTTVAKSRKNQSEKNATESTYREIDNYDFLYNDEEDTFSDAVKNDIMDEAFSHLGARYRRGSKGPSAFDCSGFTSYVFGLNSFSIGSSSRSQYSQNEPVSTAEMQRGDLVFFSSPSSGSRVGHVGIVTDVNNNGTFNFIHASTSQGVTISSSLDGYYASHYIGARRVVPMVTE